MIKVYISIISHNDDGFIMSNFINIPKTIGVFNIFINVLDNIGSPALKDFCKKSGFNYYANDTIKGYGTNHNKNFDIINPKNNDVFIVCNPDVKIPIKNFDNLIIDFLKRKSDLYGVKVYKDIEKSILSPQNNKFPALLDPVISLFFGKKLYSGNPNKLSQPDWINGFFMLIKPSAYRRLGGFDDKYFLYYEDVDICHRAKRMGLEIVFNPDYYIIHEAQRKGRKILSREFILHIKSLAKYFLRFPPRKLITLLKN